MIIRRYDNLHIIRYNIIWFIDTRFIIRLRVHDILT